MTSLRQQIDGAAQELSKRFSELEATLADSGERRYGAPWGSRTPKPIETLRAFAQFVAMGHYPPASVLIDVAKAIGAYVDGERLSLESAFNVRPKPKSGTPAKKDLDDRLLANRLWLIAGRRVERNESIEKAATAMCEDRGIDKPDPQTFVRYYKRGGIGKRLEQQHRHIKDFEERHIKDKRGKRTRR